jgi:molybdopterin molybdotransferase
LEDLKEEEVKVEREKAKEIIFSSCKPLGWEVVTLEEAYGRVLAEEVFSRTELPEQNKSAVDGFAIKSSWTDQLPLTLRLSGEVQAGAEGGGLLREGETVFVMTGAPVPEGADAVVRIEDAKVEGELVTIDFKVKKGELVNFKGSEVKRGERLLSAGERLDYRKVALLAHTGTYRVKVFRRPQVGLIVTGNEVLEPEEPKRTGAVRNTNYYLLRGLLKEAGAELSYYGIVSDEPEKLKETLNQAFSRCDVVVTTGGVSKGKYDLVKEVVKGLGVELAFTQTNVRPGRPLAFGVKGEKLFFGLPGYPSATLVNALEFLLPAIRKLSGMRNYENTYFTAVAGEGLKSRKGRVDFVRVKVKNCPEGLVVFSGGSQQTSNFISSATSQAFAVIGAERGPVERGERVELLFMQEIY